MVYNTSLSYQVLVALFLFIKGQQGFFIKHVASGLCLKPQDSAYTNKSGISSYFVEFTSNCFDPTAKFRFIDNEYVENIHLKAILQADGEYNRFIVVGPKTKLTKDEVRKNFLGLKQTENGSLIIGSCKKKVCAIPATLGPPLGGHFLNLTTTCDTDSQKFVFGSATCEGTTVNNVNCNNRSQEIVIQSALIGRIREKLTCSPRPEDCRKDVTNLVKMKCDKKSSCSFFVTYRTLGDPCPGYYKGLYLEYNCAEKKQTMTKNSVDVKLASSVLPNEGLLKIEMDNISSYVCNKSLSNQGREVICHQLGYQKQKAKQVKFPDPTVKIRLGRFSGKIYCNGEEKELSECCFDSATQVEDCSHSYYILCSICSEPLLEDQAKFPDSGFTSSSSLFNHPAAKARISSNSSWCAPSNGEHFLDIDLGRGYVINSVAMFGDTAMTRWISSYKLNYTLGGVNWMELLKQKKKEIDGNTAAFNNVAILKVNNIQARVLRFIPTKSIGQPCMRVEICGHTLFPDAVKNLAVTKITSTSLTFSWNPSLNTGDKDLSGFQIKLMTMKSLIRNFTIADVQTTQYHVTGLSPYTEYTLTVAAGSVHGFGEERTISFTTAESVPSGPPRHITIIAQSSSSLSVSWEEPDEDKKNGIITQYTVCISQHKDGTCFREYATKNRSLLILNLNASTKYFIRIRASTSAGDGIFSSSQVQYTNEGIKSSQGCSKTLLYVVVSVLLVITAALSLVIFYMCVNRQKHNDSKNERIVSCVDNKTFSEGNYEEVQVACPSNGNIEKNNFNPYEELHQDEHKQDHTYQPLQKKTG